MPAGVKVGRLSPCCCSWSDVVAPAAAAALRELLRLVSPYIVGGTCRKMLLAVSRSSIDIQRGPYSRRCSLGSFRVDVSIVSSLSVSALAASSIAFPSSMDRSIVRASLGSPWEDGTSTAVLKFTRLGFCTATASVAPSPTSATATDGVICGAVSSEYDCGITAVMLQRLAGGLCGKNSKRTKSKTRLVCDTSVGFSGVKINQ